MEDDYAPRPKASQIAAAKRARATLESDTPPAPRRGTSRQQFVLAGIAAAVIVLSMIGMTYQLSGGRPKPLATPQPTVEPTESVSVLSAPPTAAPAPTSAPQLTIAPTEPPVPTQPPQTGRGLGAEPQAPAVATPEPPAPVEPTYIEVVAEQAPHSPRSGVTGPCDGSCVVVPTLAPAQLEVIGAQKPHKVR